MTLKTLVYLHHHIYLGVGWTAICTQNPGIARKGRGGRGSFGRFVHNALRALQSAHLSPKSDNLPPKCAIILGAYGPSNPPLIIRLTAVQIKTQMKKDELKKV